VDSAGRVREGVVMVVWAWERPAEWNAVSLLKAASISLSGSGGLPARRPYPHRNKTAGVEFKCLITGVVPKHANF